KGLVERVSEDDADANLAGAYIALLARQLEFLRYRIDCGHRQAIDLRAAFEERVVALVRERESPGLLLGAVGAAMFQAKLDAGPVLRALQQEFLEDDEEGEEREDVEADIAAALSDVSATCGGDVFAVIESLAEATHAMPGAARSLFAARMLTG